MTLDPLLTRATSRMFRTDAGAPCIQRCPSLRRFLPELDPLPQLNQSVRTHAQTVPGLVLGFNQGVSLVCGVIKTVFEGLSVRLASLTPHFLISLTSLIVALWLRIYLFTVTLVFLHVFAF